MARVEGGLHEVGISCSLLIRCKVINDLQDLGSSVDTALFHQLAVVGQNLHKFCSVPFGESLGGFAVDVAPDVVSLVAG